MPIVQFSDHNVMQAARTPNKDLPKRWINDHDQLFVSDADYVESYCYPDVNDMPLMEDDLYNFHQSRSPSFNATNLAVRASPILFSDTGAVVADLRMAVSEDDEYLVVVVNAVNGTMVQVYNVTTQAPLGSFQLNGMGMGNCSGTTLGEANILFDDGVWIIVERAAVETQLCMYVSATSNPLSAYSAFSFDMAPYETRYPQLSVWGRTYSLSFAMNQTAAPELCALERAEVRSFIPTVNMTAPRILCAAPLAGRLNTQRLQAWSPVHALSVPPLDTESAGAPGPGAVFMRQVDDELYEGTSTPLTDFVEITHWYNLNWNTPSVTVLRYRVNINDYNASSTPLIQTPSLQVRPYTALLGSGRLVYRGNSVLGAFTSTTGLRWFELRWTQPSIIIPKSWRLHQQGRLDAVAPTRRFWIPSITVDTNGTMYVLYSSTDAATGEYPSLYATSRLVSDPMGQFRAPLLIRQGQVGSVLVGGNQWGRTSEIVALSDHVIVGGIVSSVSFPFTGIIQPLRLKGETFIRTWRADDTCMNTITCNQTITLQ